MLSVELDADGVELGAEHNDPRSQDSLCELWDSVSGY
jgi:hypothetical protein